MEGNTGLGSIGVSDDGSVISGDANTTPMVWRQGRGFALLAGYLAANGANLPNGFAAVALTAMSPDGRTFAGRCSVNGAAGNFIVTLPPYCGGADFNGDGDTATDADIEAFFACIAGDCCPSCGSADFNGDGDTATDADIEAFFRVLAGGHC